MKRKGRGMGFAAAAASHLHVDHGLDGGGAGDGRVEEVWVKFPGPGGHHARVAPAEGDPLGALVKPSGHIRDVVPEQAEVLLRLPASVDLAMQRMRARHCCLTLSSSRRCNRLSIFVQQSNYEFHQIYGRSFRKI